MKRSLIVFILVVILIVSVVVSSERSEQATSDNSGSQNPSESNIDIINPNSEESSDISTTTPDSQISSSDVVSNSQNNNEQNDVIENANSNEDNSGNNNEEKITICHKPGTPAEKTLEISSSALDGHLGHGDYIGECSNGNTDTGSNGDSNENTSTNSNGENSGGDITGNTVNNAPNNGNDNSGNSQHDYVNLPKETPSNNKEQTPIVTNSNEETQNLKEEKKDVPINLNSITGNVILDNENVIICHKPGTPAEQTMSISKEALSGHLGHGDFTGFCNNIKFKADAGYDQAVNERENVVFYGNSGITNLGLPVNYIWDFGDGKTAESINLKNPVHVYDKEGVYYVKLTVKIGDYVSEDKLAIDVSDIDN